jgi:hypothetical protein
VPETWVIDPNGYVRARFISESPQKDCGFADPTDAEQQLMGSASVNRRLKGWPGWLACCSSSSA